MIPVDMSMHFRCCFDMFLPRFSVSISISICLNIVYDLRLNNINAGEHQTRNFQALICLPLNLVNQLSLVSFYFQNFTYAIRLNVSTFKS